MMKGGAMAVAPPFSWLLDFGLCRRGILSGCPVLLDRNRGSDAVIPVARYHLTRWEAAVQYLMVASSGCRRCCPFASRGCGIRCDVLHRVPLCDGRAIRRAFASARAVGDNGTEELTASRQAEAT